MNRRLRGQSTSDGKRMLPVNSPESDMVTDKSVYHWKDFAAVTFSCSNSCPRNPDRGRKRNKNKILQCKIISIV